MRISLVATRSYFHNVLLLFMETVKAGRKSFLLKAPGKFIDVDLADLRIEIQHILYRVLQRGHLLLEDIVYL